MPVCFLAPSYPKLKIGEDYVSLESKHGNERCTWSIVPGSMLVNVQREWESGFGKGTLQHRLHAFDWYSSAKGMFKALVKIDLEYRCGEMQRGYFMPYRARLKSVENGGRWFCKQTKGFVHRIMAQATERRLEDARMIFSATGMGYGHEIEEYMDSIPDGRRDHLWCYGARVTMPNKTDAVPWHNWTDHYMGWRQWELSKSQRKLLYSMPGGTSPHVAHRVTWAKPEINFRIPSERMVWHLIASARMLPEMDWGAIQRSSMYNIRKAMRMVCEHLGHPNLRKPSTLGAVCDYITEIRPRPRQTVFDWAKESIAWHADIEMRRERERLERERLSAERKKLLEKARVPVFTRELPPGFRQLTEKHEFDAEAEVMHHCVDSYWRGAKLGQYFIIHYDDDTDPGCTIQLTLGGTVRQNQGPHHRMGEVEQKSSAAIAAWAAKGKFFNEEDITHGAGRTYHPDEIPF